MTLTGPGGTGKTRLALQVAADLMDRFADGVFFVDLAPIADPSLIAATIAPVLGVPERGEHLLDDLKRHVQSRTLLLVLDNFEQILAGAPVVAELLAASAGLKILVTSRAALQVRGEQQVEVPPLAAPDLSQAPGAGALGRSAPAVPGRRPVRRAGAGRPGGVRAHRGERPGRRRHLRSPGRPAARDRAGRRPGPPAASGGDGRPPGAAPPAADRRRARPAGPPADAQGHDRLELRPAARSPSSGCSAVSASSSAASRWSLPRPSATAV